MIAVMAALNAAQHEGLPTPLDLGIIEVTNRLSPDCCRASAVHHQVLPFLVTFTLLVNAGLLSSCSQL